MEYLCYLLLLFLRLPCNALPAFIPIQRTKSPWLNQVFNPYAIAEIIPKVKRKPGDKGVVSYFPESKEAALKIVKNIELRNHRYSVGLMQITSTNFAKFGTTAEKMFDPCENLKVSEKYWLTVINEVAT